MHTFYGGVGEVVNTLVCGTSIHGFDSHTPPHFDYKTPFRCFFNYTIMVKKIYMKDRITLFHLFDYTNYGKITSKLDEILKKDKEIL